MEIGDQLVESDLDGAEALARESIRLAGFDTAGWSPERLEAIRLALGSALSDEEAFGHVIMMASVGLPRLAHIPAERVGPSQQRPNEVAPPEDSSGERDGNDSVSFASVGITVASPTATRSASLFAWVRNIGAILLLFVAWQLFGTALSEHHAQHVLAREFTAELQAKDRVMDGRSNSLAKPAAPRKTPTATARVSVPSKAARAPLNGQLVARISIPVIGLDQFVVEGTEESDLAEGPGHYAGTALPGESGNVAIAGHRTTYGAPFNRLGDVAIGDSIYLTTTSGVRLHYVVRSAPSAVAPTDVAILDNFGDNRLTLTTCTPEFSAAERLVVVGELVPTTAPNRASALIRASRGEPRHQVSLTGRSSRAQSRQSVIEAAPVGWSFSKLPLALLACAILVLLGLTNRRIVARTGRLAGWIVMIPVWSLALYFALQSTSGVVPPNI